ncbi:hypothetical protein FCL40_08275 [Ferrimonas sediminicola]|uniref:Outer membrane protein beta-barrel domain-containing protein n=1 Tax=Ferrimonas sediminicola TaxID=2569538 RepID=A0A4U1BH29_9GAMM|nr:hypothetical protein [Ferrimonas sediminicola]TKB49321.1 hypothetical protein FCL40_08275 [Ferrimonas sediminicola]
MQSTHSLIFTRGRGRRNGRLLAGVMLLWTTAASAAIDYDLPQDEPSRWSGYVGGGYSRNSYSSDSHHAYEAFYLNARLGYRTDFGQFRLTVGGEQETLHGQESTFYDPIVEYRTRKYRVNDQWSTKGSIGVVLPGNHYTKLDNLEYSFRVAGYLYWNPGDEWFFYVSPRYKYNDYKYKTSGRRVLTEHQYDVVVDALWQFTPDWYLDVTGQYIWSENYYGRQLGDRFYFAQELGWQAKPNLILAIGHNNSGRFYNPEIGQSKGFEFYDKRSSTFFLSVTQYF